MTTYRERLKAASGETEAPAPPDDGGDEEDNGDETLAELKARAEAAGVATYGTKAQIRERIEEAGE